jgi:hypothetical protein
MIGLASPMGAAAQFQLLNLLWGVPILHSADNSL